MEESTCKQDKQGQGGYADREQRFQSCLVFAKHKLRGKKQEDMRVSASGNVGQGMDACYVPLSLMS